jgi:hypothetical protein
MQGTSIFLFLAALWVWLSKSGNGEFDTRSLTFTALLLSNLGLIWSNRSWNVPIPLTLRRPNKALWWVTGTALVALGLALYVPRLRQVFRFEVLHPVDIALCAAAAVAGITWFEVYKTLCRQRPPGIPSSGAMGNHTMMKRALMIVSGWTFVTLGIAGLFLPVLQGILFLLIGLGLLSTEYAWAHRWITKLKNRFPETDKRFQEVMTKLARHFPWLDSGRRPPE